jgi:glutaredoxin-related protein
MKDVMYKQSFPALASLMVALFCISACATTETVIANADTDYQRVSISAGQKFLQKRKFVLQDAVLTHQRDNEKKSGLLGIASTTVKTGIYTFAADGFACDVEISSTTKGLGGTDSYFTLSKIPVIRFIMSDGAKHEYVTTPDGDTYVTISDDLLGQVAIGQYRSIASDTQSAISGFTVTINGDEYGVLAFYKEPALYINNTAAQLTPQSRDRLSLYLLTVYDGYMRRYQL